MEAGRRGRSRTRSTSAFRPAPATWLRLPTLTGSGAHCPFSRQYSLGPRRCNQSETRQPQRQPPGRPSGGRQFLSTLVGLSHFSRPSGRLHQALEFGDCLQFRGLGRSRVRQRGTQSREGLPYRGTPDGFVRPRALARARAGVAEGRGRCVLKGGWARLAQTSQRRRRDRSLLLNCSPALCRHGLQTSKPTPVWEPPRRRCKVSRRAVYKSSVSGCL